MRLPTDSFGNYTSVKRDIHNNQIIGNLFSFSVNLHHSFYVGYTACILTMPSMGQKASREVNSIPGRTNLGKNFSKFHLISFHCSDTRSTGDYSYFVHSTFSNYYLENCCEIWGPTTTLH